jgi:hypothetical protein
MSRIRIGNDNSQVLKALQGETPPPPTDTCTCYKKSSNVAANYYSNLPVSYVTMVIDGLSGVSSAPSAYTSVADAIAAYTSILASYPGNTVTNIVTTEYDPATGIGGTWSFDYKQCNKDYTASNCYLDAWNDPNIDEDPSDKIQVASTGCAGFQPKPCK